MDCIVNDFVASADRARSNSWVMFLAYSRNTSDFHPPICLILYSLIPAAAIAVAPPMRNEWDETRLGSRSYIFAIACSFLLRYVGLSVHLSVGMWKNGRRAPGRACCTYRHRIHVIQYVDLSVAGRVTLVEKISVVSSGRIILC